MATIATRLESDGTLLLNGEFDEYTSAGNATFAARLSSATSTITGFYDEVTYNLMDPEIKNLLTYTQQINAVDWSNSNNTITANTAAAPDGSVTASRIEVSPTGYTAKLNVNVTNGAEYTFSFWVKSFDGSTGTWGTNWYSITSGHHRTTVPVTGDWTRQSITFTADNSQINVYVADDRSALATVDDAYVWGAQLEPGNTATIYQPIAAIATLVDTGMRQRTDSDGNQYVANIFDEFTGAPVVDGNLVLWLDAGQSISYAGTGNTWTNLANASANTTLVNSPTFDNSGWFSFNGTDQSANTGLPGATTFTTDSDFTIACWAKFSAYKPAAASIGTLVGAFNYQGYGLYWNGTSTTYTFGSYMRFDSTVSSVISAAVSLDTWYLVTQSYSRASNFHRLYLNATESGNTSTISGTFNSNLDTVSIGIASGAGSGGTPGGGTPGTPFLGEIGQVMIYDRALTADEVTQNFNALRRRYGI